MYSVLTIMFSQLLYILLYVRKCTLIASIMCLKMVFFYTGNLKQLQPTFVSLGTRYPDIPDF